MKIRLDNTYACGRESSTVVEVDEPAWLVEEWWDDVVAPLTGDGHEPCASREHALYEATVVAADDPALLGCTHTWGE